MNKKHLFLSAALFAVACNCGAQSLNKEITVERDIVPEYRDADRLRISPVVSLPQVVRQNLTYSFVDRPVGVTPVSYTHSELRQALMWRRVRTRVLPCLRATAALELWRLPELRSKRL